jgi:outer membrane protein OmpA-like peptidoglycan-associated protein
MRNSLISLLAAAALYGIGAGASQAESDYSHEDVVKFFAQTVELGAARGICIGGSSECAPVPDPGGMDMMVTFEHDSFELSSRAQNNLTIFAKALNDTRLKFASFIVEGHTDASGTEIYNKRLSQDRAAAVMAFLKKKGVAQDRLQAFG